MSSTRWYTNLNTQNFKFTVCSKYFKDIIYWIIQFHKSFTKISTQLHSQFNKFVDVLIYFAKQKVNFELVETLHHSKTEATQNRNHIFIKISDVLAISLIYLVFISFSTNTQQSTRYSWYFFHWQPNRMSFFNNIFIFGDVGSCDVPRNDRQNKHQHVFFVFWGFLLHEQNLSKLTE